MIVKGQLEGHGSVSLAMKFEDDLSVVDTKLEIELELDIHVIEHDEGLADFYLVGVCFARQNGLRIEESCPLLQALRIGFKKILMFDHNSSIYEVSSKIIQFIYGIRGWNPSTPPSSLFPRTPAEVTPGEPFGRL